MHIPGQFYMHINTVWGEINVTLFKLSDSRTKIEVKATSNYDNIYALFSSPNQKIIKALKNGLNVDSTVSSSKGGNGVAWKWIAICVVALAMIGMFSGNSKNTSDPLVSAGKKDAEYQKGSKIDIALNNRDDFLHRMGGLVEMIDGKPKDQCFDLVFMYWQDFEQRFNQGQSVYSFRFQASLDAEGMRLVSIGQLPQQLCGIGESDAEEMFKQRRLLNAKLNGTNSAEDAARGTINANPVAVSQAVTAEPVATQVPVDAVMQPSEQQQRTAEQGAADLKKAARVSVEIHRRDGEGVRNFV